MLKKTLITLVFCLLCTSLVFAAGAQEKVEVRPERLIEALSPTTGETHRFWTVHNWEMLNPALESLVGHDQETGEYAPNQLAESWSHNDTMTEWTFHLREGVQFHYGWGEVTSDDVVHSFHLQTGDDAAVPGVEQIRDAEVTAVDRYTVRFAFDNPQLDFLFLHGGRTVMFIYSKAQYDKEGLAGYDRQLVGTGPYKFVERSPGRILYRSVEDHYSGVEPAFKELEIRFIDEASTRLAMLMTGEAHIAEIPRELHQEAVTAGLRLIRSTGSSMQTNIAMNGLYGSTVDGEIDPAYRPDLPWANVKIREAINIAINRQEMVDVLFYGLADLVTVYGMGKGHTGYDPKFEKMFEEQYAYNPERARELLKEVNYPDAFPDPVIPLVIIKLSGQPEVPLQMELVQQYLDNVGFQTRIIEYDSPRVAALGRAREAYFLHPMRNAPIRPTQVALQAFYTRPGGPYQGYESDKSIGYFKALQASVDPDERQKIATEAFTYLFEQYSSVPLFEVPTVVVVDPKVIGQWVFPGVTNNGISHWHLIEPAR